eukprot:PhM_4_TR10854/c1_g1_i1/m.86512
MMKSNGLVSEEANAVANQRLTDAVEYMKSEEYQKQRDLSDVIPTHQHLVPQKPKPAPEPEPVQQKQNRDGSDDESDDEDDDIAAWRAARAADLKRKQEQAARHGVYVEISQEDFFKTVVREQGGSDCVVLHFFHDDFQMCELMHQHLVRLAPEMKTIKFAKVNVKNASFLVDKLSVNVLPTLLFFRNDVCIDRMVGFEDLGGTEFPDDMLEKRILFGLKLE